MAEAIEAPAEDQGPTMTVHLRTKLLKSHLIIAAIGMLGLVLALIAIWNLGNTAKHLANESAPMVKSSLRVLSGIQTSLAATRGWITVGEPSFIAERNQAWKLSIYPEVNEIIALRNSTTNRQDQALLSTLKHRLQSLEEIQWWIIEVAQTPGNLPALNLYSEQVSPVIRSIQAAASSGIMSLEKQQTHSPQRKTLFNLTSDFRYYFSRSASLLHEYLVDGNDNSKIEFKRHLKISLDLSNEISAWFRLFTLDQNELYLLIHKELLAYQLLSSKAITLRNSTEWNIALSQLTTTAIPMARSLTDDLNKLSIRHSLIMAKDSDDVTAVRFKTFWIGLGLISTLVIITLLISSYSARRLTKPITTLVNATTDIAKGKLNHNIPITSNDELGDLTHSFNKMTTSLGISQNELKLANRVLEQRVEERTIELKTTNRELEEQTKSLEVQQEELRATNENLEEQTIRLKQSEDSLNSQQEELRASNEELEEKQKILSEQKETLEVVNKEVKKKAEELTEASKYKSEFLANMSHELRTPLNSLLLLSKDLCSNREGNLSRDQLEDVQIIYEGGTDLLTLINDIMDLSKVEAGMLTVNPELFSLAEITQDMCRLFEKVAKEKKLTFEISISDDLPKDIVTDSLRLKQILKNLLSNAFKFTAEGRVSLSLSRPAAEVVFSRAELTHETVLAIAVTDSGIGIPADKQSLIFSAFQQADGSTSRKYGGTGLGLSITKELTQLLEGEIQLTSAEGKGSVFTLFLPLKGSMDSQTEHTDTNSVTTATHTPFITDDRENTHRTDKSILIIEDDPLFAKVLYDQVHQYELRCLVTNQGKVGVAMAETFLPNGIILDLGLPDISGHTVLEQLSASIKTRHIPVHVVSGREGAGNLISQGAHSFNLKPVDKDAIASILHELSSSVPAGKVLVVEDDTVGRHAISRSLSLEGLTLDFVGNANQALEKLEDGPTQYHCIVLDLGLPGMDGDDLLDEMHARYPDTLPPVIIHTGRELNDTEHAHLAKLSVDIIIKGKTSSNRLLDEVTLFLHSMAPPKISRQKESASRAPETVEGHNILLVDDDVRNCFALSKQLIQRGYQVAVAENGQAALDYLAVDKKVELILMDIMMPVMNGYEATTAIRQIKNYEDIPIIAATAKAMPEDKKKCLDAGASDYIIKPIDLDELLKKMQRLLSAKAVVTE